jgi:hypothetical protein
MADPIAAAGHCVGTWLPFGVPLSRRAGKRDTRHYVLLE